LEQVFKVLSLFKYQNLCVWRLKINHVSIKWHEYMLCICYLYIDSLQNWHIDCPKSTNTKSWHIASVISSYMTCVDIQYLQILIEHEVQRMKKKCIYIDATNAKCKFCNKSKSLSLLHTHNIYWVYAAFNYSQDLDHVCQHKCNVQFDLYILIKWNRFSFLLLVSCGRYDHYSSYSIKLFKDIVNKVVQIIREQECLNLIAHKFHTCNAYAMLILNIDCFILSSQFTTLCRKHGELSINTLHQSLNIEDWVAILI